MKITCIAVALLLVSFSLFAQPTGQYLQLQGYPQHGYIEIPNDPLLDAPAMTVEAWVAVQDAHSSQCSSIAGMGYVNGWWLGLCGTSMRSYFNGSASQRTGGVISDTPKFWIHIAAVTDGTTRKHYINGELVFQSTETPRSAATKPLRIGSDPDWDYMAAGALDDLRIWKVARTQDQIRQTMFAPFISEANDVTGKFQGLEAWYRFEGNAQDSWHAHHGALTGTGVGFGNTQPAGQYLQFQGFPQQGYIEIPNDAALDSPAMTVEAWVSVRDAHNGTACSSIAGTGYLTGWWLGLCGTDMRSYFNGVSSQKTGGTIPNTPDMWVHIAAVTDGTTRRHYINGELVFEAAETAAQSASTKPLRIGSDPDWDYEPAGGINDLRIWRVARTQDQIRQTMYAPFVLEANDVAGQFQGLEAWYRFEDNALDSWRTHHGTIIGTGIGFAGTPLVKRRGARH